MTETILATMAGKNGEISSMNRLVQASLRAFSSTSRMSIEYNVIVYDFPGADRSKVRPQHFAGIAPTVNEGIVKSAGAIYQDDEKTKFAGSTFHLVANNRDEVIDFLKKDIYYKEGIWNLDNVVINPLGLAVRLPKKLDGVNDELFKL